MVAFVAQVELSLTIEELTALKNLSPKLSKSVEDVARLCLAKGIEALTLEQVHQKVDVAIEDAIQKQDVAKAVKRLKREAKCKGPACKI